MRGSDNPGIEVVGGLLQATDSLGPAETRPVSDAWVTPWPLAAFLAAEAGAFAWALGSDKIPPVVLSLFRALLTF
jgi:hypothetical protein